MDKSVEKTSIRHKLYLGFIVGLLSLAMMFSLVDRFTLSLLFEPIKADLGLSDTELGLLHGVAFGLFYAFMGLPIAWLVDRWSRKWVIFSGMGLWAIMTALCGFAGNYVQLMLARIGVGVGEAALAPAGYSILTDYFSKKRLATAISVFQMGSLIGGGVAYLLGGAIYQYMVSLGPVSIAGSRMFAPWQMTFIIAALPGIPLLLLFLLIKEPIRKITNLPAQTKPDSPNGFWAYLRSKWKVYAAICIGNSCLIAITYGGLSWIPTMMVRQFNLSIAETSIYFGFILLITAPIGVLLGGHLADRRAIAGKSTPYSYVLLIAAFLLVPLVLLMPFMTTVTELFILIGVIQLVAGIPVGVGPALIQMITSGQYRGRVSAVYVLTVNVIGLGISPVIIGFLSDNIFDGNSALMLSLTSFNIVTLSLGIFLLLIFNKRENNLLEIYEE